MKETTKKLEQQVSEAHDWKEGQKYSGGGTELHSTDECRVCLLRRHWQIDSQNNIASHYRWSDGETGQDLSLRQAAARGCTGQ